MPGWSQLLKTPVKSLRPLQTWCHVLTFKDWIKVNLRLNTTKQCFISSFDFLKFHRPPTLFPWHLSARFLRMCLFLFSLFIFFFFLDSAFKWNHVVSVDVRTCSPSILAWCLLGPSVLMQMARSHAFLWLSNIPPHTPRLFHSFASQWTPRSLPHLRCCKSCRSEHRSATYLSQAVFLLSVDKCPAVALVGRVAALFLIFWGISTSFSIAAAVMYKPMRSLSHPHQHSALVNSLTKAQIMYFWGQVTGRRGGEPIPGSAGPSAASSGPGCELKFRFLLNWSFFLIAAVVVRFLMPISEFQVASLSFLLYWGHNRNTIML